MLNSTVSLPRWTDATAFIGGFSLRATSASTFSSMRLWIQAHGGRLRHYATHEEARRFQIGAPPVSDTYLFSHK